jgi:hypothetical protein
MKFFEAVKIVIGTLFYWADRIVSGNDAYPKEYWQE